MEQSFEKMNIQWFPGHMTKAQRMIEENIKLVDAVCEILDARIPGASRNPDIDRLAGDKPRLVILNRCDLADPEMTARWRRYFQSRGLAILETDAKNGKGVNGFVPAVRELLKDKLKEYESKGQVGRPLRLMILGIPNVGKSTFINKVAGRKAAIAGDKDIESDSEITWVAPERIFVKDTDIGAGIAEEISDLKRLLEREN